MSDPRTEIELTDAQHDKAMRLHIVNGWTMSDALAIATGICPVCGGDCAGANPPVINCPMKV